MDDEQLAGFRARYRGRHRPEDALWWLSHPDEAGPSSAPPVQWALLRAIDELEAGGDPQSARALAELAAEVVAVDRRAARDALLDTESAPPCG